MFKCPNNTELRQVSTTAASKTVTGINSTVNRSRSILFRYLKFCRSKNQTPSLDNATTSLDFYGDKLSYNDWVLFKDALFDDQILQVLEIRMRKAYSAVLDQVDTEKKAKLYRQKPAIFTQFIFVAVIRSISNCIQFNKNLKILSLEGLPLNDRYVEIITQALSHNESLKEISFQRSAIYDKGCEAICNTIKYMENVEKLNLSECELSSVGAEYIADMIKIQKIRRYTEGWQQSLRYRNVDPETIPGLRSILMARNPCIGDDGAAAIVEVLKEDAWIKMVDMEHCGLTDRSASMILECLELNKTIADFNVSGNADISKFLIHKIRRLEEKLHLEMQLNEKLNQKIIQYENQIENESKFSHAPDGYTLIKNDILDGLLKERNDYRTRLNGLNGYKKPQASEFFTNGHYEASDDVRSFEIDNDEGDVEHDNCNDGDDDNVYDDDDDDNVDYDNDDSCSTDAAIAPPLNSPSSDYRGKELPLSSRKSLKLLRKVRSEMKYEETKTHSKKKESRSDHEFANENDFHLTSVHFETNIGDAGNNATSRSNTSSATITNAKNKGQKKERNRNQAAESNNKYSNNNNPIPNTQKKFEKFELDSLSISTSQRSDIFSSDSDTLRNQQKERASNRINKNELQPTKVFIKRTKRQQSAMPLTPMPNRNRTPREQSPHYKANGDKMLNHNNQEENSRRSTQNKSPRSLFFGL